MTSYSVQNIPPLMALDNLITGCWKAQLVFVAAKLELTDLLKNGPLSADELTKMTQCHGPSLERVLRGLVSIEILSYSGDGRYQLTPIGACLQNGAPGDMRIAAIETGEEWHWRAWGALLYTVRTGETAFHQAFGKNFYTYLDEQPEASDIFSEFMASFLRKMCTPLVTVYDFAPYKTVVDVGGGLGVFSAALLRAYPHLHCVIFDRPQVIEETRRRLVSEELSDRCTFIGGNFLEAVPKGYDLYLLSMVLDDWQDEQATTILENCRTAMCTDSRLLMAQHLLSPEDSTLFGTILDLYMMVLAGGQERTEIQYRQLLKVAGLKVTRIIHSYAPMSFIECERG